MKAKSDEQIMQELLNKFNEETVEKYLEEITRNFYEFVDDLDKRILENNEGNKTKEIESYGAFKEEYQGKAMKI